MDAARVIKGRVFNVSIVVPILLDLLPGGIPYGSSLLIEYDPDSSYYKILETMVHELLSAGHTVSFFDYTRFPDQLRQDLRSLGSDVDRLESEGRFHLYDGYSATLGIKSKEKLAFESLRVNDLSLFFLKLTKAEKPITRDIGFSDSGSVSLRYNDEKAFLDFYASRVIPRVRLHERISFSGFVTGVHSTSFYKTMEDLCEGVIDVKFDDSDGTPKTKLRIRTFKLGKFDGSWQLVRSDGPRARLDVRKT